MLPHTILQIFMHFGGDALVVTKSLIIILDITSKNLFVDAGRGEIILWPAVVQSILEPRFLKSCKQSTFFLGLCIAHLEVYGQNLIID